MEREREREREREKKKKLTHNTYIKSTAQPYGEIILDENNDDGYSLYFTSLHIISFHFTEDSCLFQRLSLILQTHEK